MLTQQCRHVARRSHSHRADQVVRLEFLKRTFRVAESPCWILIQAHTLATPLLIRDEWNISVFGEEAMWMRPCAVCKALMMKLRLRDSVRCQCGWKWEW